jgi:hypothetical protein|nr:MAG TPA: hypothetical protein [Caudoviricetes sp.]
MNYSLVLQHTVTKQIYIYNLNNQNYSENIYYKFDITLDDNTPDGEYQYVLFYNPNKWEIVIDPNNIYQDQYNSYVLVTYDNILTTNTKILIAGKPIPILSTGLIRIGDYENQRYQYDRQNQYISYERK